MERQKVIIICVLLLLTVTSAYQILHRDRDNDIIQVAGSSNCNHVFRNQTFGILTSPYYPLGYPDGTTCKWTISMEEGTRVVLSIKSFMLGPGDSLLLSEKNGEREYNFTNPPEDVTFSSDHAIIVELKTEQSVESNNESMIAEIRKNRTFYAVFEKEGCGGLLTTSSGYITIPTYIHTSGKSHECSWTILSSSSNVIILQFLQFDLPPGSCLFNNIYIREGGKSGGYVLGNFCEENPPYDEIRSSSNIMYIAYRSRPNFLSQRTEIVPTIKMYYKTSAACGGSLKGFSGSFATPRSWIDEVYSCNWTIEVPHEKQISVKFQQWFVANYSESEYDELRIISSGSSNSIVWFSNGNLDPPDTITIPSNRATISLTSQRNKTSTTKIRFHGVYQAIKVDEKPCIDVGYKQLYMCDDWQYIDCSLKCNGIAECDNARDELNCPLVLLSKSIIMQHHTAKHQTSGSYAVLLFAIVGILMIVATLTIVLERFYRSRYSNRRTKRSKRRKRPSLPSLSPPPYVEREDQPCALPRGSTPPPPYSPEVEHSEDTDGLTDVLQLNDFQFTDNSSTILSDTQTQSNNDETDVRSASTESTGLFHDTDILGSSSDIYTRSMSSLIIDDMSTETDEISATIRTESTELKTEASGEQNKTTEFESSDFLSILTTSLLLDDALPSETLEVNPND